MLAEAAGLLLPYVTGVPGSHRSVQRLLGAGGPGPGPGHVSGGGGGGLGDQRSIMVGGSEQRRALLLLLAVLRGVGRSPRALREDWAVSALVAAATPSNSVNGRGAAPAAAASLGSRGEERSEAMAAHSLALAAWALANGDGAEPGGTAARAAEVKV
jgi:hypothetical protein